MTSTTADRIPLADLEGIITRALAQGDYEHDAEWTRPPGCPCHDRGLSCLAVQAAGDRQACQGYPAEVPTPEQHVVNLAILTAALPEPDNDGTVDAVQAASSILSAIGQRLAPFPYTLRAHSLARRLTEEAEAWEQSTGAADTGVPAVPLSVLTCQWCQGPIPLARGPKARYCRNSHRVSAHRAKKREQERQANAGTSPGR